ncbi:MAG: hypothetical protein ABR575_06855 [Actinomycetota bacterium]
MRRTALNRSKRWGVALATSAVIAAGALPAAASPEGSATRAAMARGCRSETIILTTLKVTMKPLRKSYRIGQSAKFEVTVTRPGETDPLGQQIPLGEPPMSLPAEGVGVGIGVQVGLVFLPGFGTTDANGKAIIRVRLEPYTRPGVAHAKALATYTQFESTCLNIEEQGFRFVPNAFRVSR